MDPPGPVSSLLGQLRDPPGELVLAAQPDPLRGGRGVQLEVQLGPTVSPGGSHRGLDGVEDGGGQGEWRLPHRLAGVDSSRVAHTAQQADVKLRGNVIETGNFVGPWT